MGFTAGEVNLPGLDFTPFCLVTAVDIALVGGE